MMQMKPIQNYEDLTPLDTTEKGLEYFAIKKHLINSDDGLFMTATEIKELLENPPFNYYIGSWNSIVIACYQLGWDMLCREESSIIFTYGYNVKIVNQPTNDANKTDSKL